ncbi:hypothetical protein [Streptomyces sp. NBC_01167]|uniref:hypothetical protein n=1 Tax=Streptomyces sp. NBC_01167 TaxID=2903756 RepID=UPI0038633CB7
MVLELPHPVARPNARRGRAPQGSSAGLDSSPRRATEMVRRNAAGSNCRTPGGVTDMAATISGTTATPSPN